LKSTSRVRMCKANQVLTGNSSLTSPGSLSPAQCPTSKLRGICTCFAHRQITWVVLARRGTSSFWTQVPKAPTNYSYSSSWGS
jgi:hypothetical protein